MSGGNWLPEPSGYQETMLIIGVQQKLMRHAQVSTTLDVYGNAPVESKREANSQVVRMVLRQAV